MTGSRLIKTGAAVFVEKMQPNFSIHKPDFEKSEQNQLLQRFIHHLKHSLADIFFIQF